jgi:hypothetical protein
MFSSCEQWTHSGFWTPIRQNIMTTTLAGVTVHNLVSAMQASLREDYSCTTRASDGLCISISARWVSCTRAAR